jgi:hypothetical protein
VRLPLLILLLPVIGRCAALAPDALSVFQKPGVPPALYAKIEHGVPLTLDDVVTLSRADVSRGAMIDYLYSFGRHFRITSAEAAELRRQGVSPDIIDYILSPSSHPPLFAF